MGCGPKMTPEETLFSADKLQSIGGHEEALKRYRSLLEWSGEEEVSGEIKFNAALKSLNCLAVLGRFEEAVRNFTSLEKTYPEKMSDQMVIEYAIDLVSFFFHWPGLDDKPKEPALEHDRWYDALKDLFNKCSEEKYWRYLQEDDRKMKIYSDIKKVLKKIEAEYRKNLKEIDWHKMWEERQKKRTEEILERLKLIA